jgi:hypothetical protein
MSDGGWQWSDASGMAAVGVLFTTISGWFYKNLSDKASDAVKKAEEVGKDLADYKVSAVEKFVPRAHLDQMKAEIIQRIDQQDSALRSSFGQVTDRLDRILETRHNEGAAR